MLEVGPVPCQSHGRWTVGAKRGGEALSVKVSEDIPQHSQNPWICTRHTTGIRMLLQVPNIAQRSDRRKVDDIVAAVKYDVLLGFLTMESRIQ